MATNCFWLLPFGSFYNSSMLAPTALLISFLLLSFALGNSIKIICLFINVEILLN